MITIESLICFKSEFNDAESFTDCSFFYCFFFSSEFTYSVPYLHAYRYLKHERAKKTKVQWIYLLRYFLSISLPADVLLILRDTWLSKISYYSVSCRHCCPRAESVWWCEDSALELRVLLTSQLYWFWLELFATWYTHRLVLKTEWCRSKQIPNRHKLLLLKRQKQRK